jgi:hypothetical protein
MAELQLVSELRDVDVKSGVSAPRSRYELRRARWGRWNEGSDDTERMALLFRVSSLSDSDVRVGEAPLRAIARDGPIWVSTRMGRYPGFEA